MLFKIFLTLLVFQFVSTEDENTVEIDPVEAHFDSVLALYNKFKDVDQETGDLSNQDPWKPFLENHIKPLKTQLKQFSASINTFSDSSDLSQLKLMQESVVAGIADLEIKFTNVQAEGDSIREKVVAKIDALLGQMKELEEKQKEAELDTLLDKKYGATFDPYGHHSLSTLIEVEVLKMSIGVIQDLPASLKQLRNEAGIPATDEEVEKLSKDEVVRELADRLVLKKNDGVTPATWLPKMIRTLEDISEFFQAKISENYEALGEDYAEHSKKIEKYWKSLQQKVKELEVKTSPEQSKDEL